MKDWEAVERIWKAGLAHVNMEAHHPLMVAEPSYNTQSIRQKHLELLFETFQPPAVFFCKDAVLSAFAAGRSTALVVDMGGGKTSAVPVQDGYVLHKGVKRTKVAGDHIDSVFLNKLAASAPNFPQARFEYQRQFVSGSLPAAITPGKQMIPVDGGYFLISKLTQNHVTNSFRDYSNKVLIQDIKSQPFVQVLANPFLDPNAQLPVFQYELPDGSTLDLGTERFTVPELMFTPDSSCDIKDDFERFTGLAALVNDSVNACEVDARKELFANIVLTGGHSLYGGITQRLQNSLTSAQRTAAVRIKVVSQAKSDRMFGVWMGGSILASLGSFHQMWFSQSEYSEHGAAIMSKKCP